MVLALSAVLRCQAAVHAPAMHQTCTSPRCLSAAAIGKVQRTDEVILVVLVVKASGLRTTLHSFIFFIDMNSQRPRLQLDFVQQRSNQVEILLHFIGRVERDVLIEDVARRVAGDIS